MTVKRVIPIIAIALVLFAGLVAYLFFFPRRYNAVHLRERDGIKYWKLSTGSRIGYTFIPANEKKSHYPIIYLHGGPGAGITSLEVSTYKKISDAGYDVYLYDQVGCGHSSRLSDIGEYSAERHKKDLEEIVTRTGADKVILVGQSWGAILSTLFVADNLSKVAKLVIAAPAPIQPAQEKYADLSPPDSIHLRDPMYHPKYAMINASNIRSKAVEYWVREFRCKLASDREADEFQTYMTNLLNKSMVCDPSSAVQAEGTEGYYANFMTRLSLGKVSDPRPNLAKSDVPVLIMNAQCDIQKWGYTAEYLELFRNHRLVFIENAGHNIFIEQPDVYVSTICSFIAAP